MIAEAMDESDPTAVAEVAQIFRAMIDAANQAHMGVAISRVDDGELTIVYASQAMETILGYDNQSLLSRPVLSIVPPEEVARVRAMSEGLIRGEPIPNMFESVALHADGRSIPLQIATSVVELGGRPAVVTFLWDISAHKANLEHLMHADKMAAVGTLAAGVAHEINNPLAYLLLNMELLTRELPKVAADPARLGQAMARLDEARQGGERVKVIVRDLQVFTRADEGMRGAVDLGATITRAVQVARHEIRQRASVELSLDPVPFVNGNATRFEQVFLNLLINASHAFSTSDVSRNRIEVTLRASGPSHITATVKDNGAGMSDAVLRRALEPFFTTKTDTGTGLGLAICHGVIHAAGGDIHLASIEGAGTTVTVTLPVRHIAH